MTAYEVQAHGHDRNGDDYGYVNIMYRYGGKMPCPRPDPVSYTHLLALGIFHLQTGLICLLENENCFKQVDACQYNKSHPQILYYQL